MHIIGAGPGGLASAMLLAASGAKVKIFERSPVIGGRTSRIEPEDAHGFHRFLAENREKLAVMKPCLETPFLGIPSRGPTPAPARKSHNTAQIHTL